MHSRVKRIGLILLGTVAGALLISMAAWAVGIALLFRDPMFENRCGDSTRFDPVIWRDPARAFSPEAPRGCMVDELLDQRWLPGRTRTEVVALLGEPRPTRYFTDYDLVYWLGPERGPFGIDSEWLVIRLDSSGRVGEAQLATD